MHRHAILHLLAKFRQNQTICMRHSYGVIFIFKVEATASQFYFRFHFRDFAYLRRSKSTCRLQTRWRNISIHGWNITISGFWKQMFVMLEFYFRFRLSRLCHHLHVIRHLPSKFRPNWMSAVELWRHSDFRNGGRQPYWVYSRLTADHPRNANDGLWLILKFPLDQI